MLIGDSGLDLKTIIEWVVGVGTGLGIIWKWIGKPVQHINQEIGKFKTDVQGQVEDIRGTVNVMQGQVEDIQGSTDFLLGDRLSQAHSYWQKKKYCPPSDKARLVEMHKVYQQRGLNHLYATYEQDLIELPDDPPEEPLDTK